MMSWCILASFPGGRSLGLRLCEAMTCLYKEAWKTNNDKSSITQLQIILSIPWM